MAAPVEPVSSIGQAPSGSRLLEWKSVWDLGKEQFNYKESIQTINISLNKRTSTQTQVHAVNTSFQYYARTHMERRRRANSCGTLKDSLSCQERKDIKKFTHKL